MAKGPTLKGPLRGHNPAPHIAPGQHHGICATSRAPMWEHRLPQTDDVGAPPTCPYPGPFLDPSRPGAGRCHHAPSIAVPPPRVTRPDLPVPGIAPLRTGPNTKGVGWRQKHTGSSTLLCLQHLPPPTATSLCACPHLCMAPTCIDSATYEMLHPSGLFPWGCLPPPTRTQNSRSL